MSGGVKLLERRQKEKGWKPRGGHACSPPPYVFVHRVGAGAALESPALPDNGLLDSCSCYKGAPQLQHCLLSVGADPGLLQTSTDADSALGIIFLPFLDILAPVCLQTTSLISQIFIW
jgi:hypothetical protein